MIAPAEAQLESRPTDRGVVDGDRGAVSLGDVADDREAEAGAERVLLLLRVGNGSLPITPAPVPLDELVSEMAATREVPLRNLVPGDLVADTDSALVTWCLAELLDNAEQFGRAPQLDILAHPGEARIRVVDRGPGLPADVVGLVFGRRETDLKRRARRGESATGLLLVSAVAERLGGRLEYDRDADETRLSLILPLQAATDRRVIDRSPPTRVPG